MNQQTKLSLFDKPTVYAVDQDRSLLNTVSDWVSEDGLNVAVYTDPELFLEDLDSYSPGCLIMNTRMPVLSGLELQKEMEKAGKWLPTIFIVNEGDISTAVRAMKGGALDCLTKPLYHQDLIELVHGALRKDAERRIRWREYLDVKTRLSELTRRERQVLDEMVLGEMNKSIASHLGITDKTVEVHRARVMKKLGMRTLVQVVRMMTHYQSIQAQYVVA